MFFSEGNSYYEKLPDGRVVCIDDEIPFEVPQSWEWIRLGSIVDFSKSGSVKSSVIGDDAWILDLEDIEKDTGKLLQKKRMRDLKSKSDKHPFSKGDVLYSKLRPYLNKVIIADEAGYCTTEILSFDFGYIFNRYAQLYLMSPFFVDYAMSDAYGVKMPRLGSKQGNAALMPIPPKSEQIRIVKEVDAIMPLVARYGKSQKQLDDINSEMKDRLRKSVLQEAIQGKLVSQVPSDEPANSLLERIRVEKQKLLKADKLKKKDIVDSLIFKGEDNKYYEKIDGKVLDINDEIPYDIPASWSWVRLQQVCTYIHRGKSPKYSEVKKFPVIAQKCNQWDGFHIEKAQFIAPESVSSYAVENLLRDKDLLWNSTGLGTLGRIGLYPVSSNPYGFAVADSHVTVIRTLPDFIRPEFLLMFFSSPTVQSVIEDKASGSTKQKELATETVKSYIVPIPPLAEQDRILDKYKTILASWS